MQLKLYNTIRIFLLFGLFFGSLIASNSSYAITLTPEKESRMIEEFGESCAKELIQILKSYPESAVDSIDSTRKAENDAAILSKVSTKCLTRIELKNPKLRASDLEKRNTQRAENIRALQAAVEQYYQDTGIYPNEISRVTIGIYLPVISNDPLLEKK